jgi:hypothetical protein
MIYLGDKKGNLLVLGRACFIFPNRQMFEEWKEVGQRDHPATARRLLKGNQPCTFEADSDLGQMVFHTIVTRKLDALICYRTEDGKLGLRVGNITEFPIAQA